MKKVTDFFCFILLLVVLSGIISCNKPPQPDFKVSPAKAKLGQEITFTDNSVGANRYSWNFGDGIVRNDGKLQKYMYTAPGSYTAALTTWNKKEKDEVTTVKTISIDNPTKDEILGTWYFYQVQDIVRWEEGFDRITPINELRTSQIYFFDNKDTLYINDYGSNLLFRRWDLLPQSGKLLIWDTVSPIRKDTLDIVKLYGDEMNLKKQKTGFFRLHFFKK